MKNSILKALMILLAPLLMATQCDDDYENLNPIFETLYVLKNSTSADLLYLDKSDAFINVPSESDIVIINDYHNLNSAILPSESFNVNPIKLFIMGENGDFILVYEQNPIDDSLWKFSEPTENNFEYNLIITEDLID